MGIYILRGGMQTTVQDAGRFGYQSQGIGMAGAMDWRSHRLANLLLNNPLDGAVLEFSLVGPQLMFTSGTIIAITGGDFSPTLNGKKLKMHKAHYVGKGDILDFKDCKNGNYGYLAFTNSLAIPELLGSRSTHVATGMGGFEGRALKQGDRLEFSHKAQHLPYFGSRQIDGINIQEKNPIIRVVLGPQDEMFPESSIQVFLNSKYTVTHETNRMGCRLEGNRIQPKTTSDIISDGIALGSIQVPSSGCPIVLLSDRQTTGGYAKIATVASVDIPKFVQVKAGAKITFQAIAVEEAQSLLEKEAAKMQRLKELVNSPSENFIKKRLMPNRLKTKLQKSMLNGGNCL